MDSEELEKELDSLLQDSSKDSLDLPPVPQGVPSTAPISDAELEAELEQLSVSAGGGKGSRGPGRELGQPWGSAGLGTVLGGMGIVLDQQSLTQSWEGWELSWILVQQS